MTRQYFVAIVLPPELDKKILAFKKIMQERYGCKVGLRSPAHITLVPPFWMNEDNESVLLKMLQPLESENSFEMVTDNFSSFPPKTIFIALKNNQRLNEIKEKVNSLLMAKEIPGIVSETRPFVPHITIATRDLHKKSFHEAWEHFREKKFDASWNAGSVSVLRHDGARWEVCGDVELLIS